MLQKFYREQKGGIVLEAALILPFSLPLLLALSFVFKLRV